MRRENSTSKELSQSLYRAASRMLRAHVAHVEMHAVLYVPEVSVEMRYLPHGATVETGLLDVRLLGLRYERITRTEKVAVDVQLKAIYARDLTDDELPYLATSDPHGVAERAVAGAHEEEAVVQIAYLKMNNRREPASVRVLLQSLHVEWNAPCIATLKRVLVRRTNSGPLPTIWPEPRTYTHQAADGKPSSLEKAKWPRGSQTAEVFVSMNSLSLSLNREAGEADDATASAKPPAASGPSAVLCVLSAEQLQFHFSLFKDGTHRLDGSMEELTAHDYRKRPHAVGGPARPVAAGPPMIRLTRSAEGAGLRFEFHRYFTDSKRPNMDGVTFEGELHLYIASMRVLWLQQWIAGAFEYLDNSILAKVVRGVGDLSIARVWVPPNRFRPMRLKFSIAEPTILLPRNVHALADETLLAEHSLHVHLKSVAGESILKRRLMPGCKELGELLCDEMTIKFEQLHVSSQLPPYNRSRPLPFHDADKPLELTLLVIKSVERPHDLVPQMAIDASLGERGTLEGA